jgi:hypothetical protein
MLFEITFERHRDWWRFLSWLSPLLPASEKNTLCKSTNQYNHMADGFACAPLTSARRAQGREKLVPTGLVEGKA